MPEYPEIELINYLEGLDTDEVISILDINSAELVSAFIELVFEKKQQIIDHMEG